MKKTQINYDWINKLIETKSVSKVAKFYNKDRSNLFNYFKRLVKENVLGKKGTYWYINNAELLLLELHGLQASVPISNLNINFINLLFAKNECQEFYINDKIKPTQYFIKFREIPQFTIKIAGNTLIFIQKKETPLRIPRTKEAAEKLELIIKNEIKDKFKFLERKLNIKLGEIEELRINTNHYAFLSDQLAKTFIKDNEKLKVYINDELRTLIDLSKGMDKPEFEEVSPQYAKTDAANWTKLITKVNTGEFDIDKLHSTIGNLARISEIQTKEYAENIKLHLETLKKIQEALERLGK